jgi:hypothetical protein
MIKFLLVTFRLPYASGKWRKSKSLQMPSWVFRIFASGMIEIFLIKFALPDA